MDAVLSVFNQWLFFLSDDPFMRMMQAGILLFVLLLVFLIFYATRDIVLRTKSLAYQIVCILLVACFPLFGFFIYLLIRPAQTIKERETEALLKEIQEGLKSKHTHS